LTVFCRTVYVLKDSRTDKNYKDLEMYRKLTRFWISIFTPFVLFGCGGSSSGEQQEEFAPILPNTFFGLYSFELPLAEEEGECNEVASLEDSVMLMGQVSPGENGAVTFDSNIGLWEGATSTDDDSVDFTVTLLVSEGGCNRSDSLDITVTTVAPGQARLHRFYDCFSAFCSQTFEGSIEQFTPDEDL